MKCFENSDFLENENPIRGEIAGQGPLGVF